MAKRSVSRCAISAKNTNNLYVTIKNTNEQFIRKFSVNVYDKESPIKTFLPIYLDDQLLNKDTLEPGTEKVYRIDVSNVKNKVIFEIIQEVSGSGISVATRKNNKSNNPSAAVLSLK
ncbi:hypothetical protein [Priestia megaterium]|uniref:hypothetical protein n=1 Tax=Priestia megaterium TaxID=1404 RepID=UPI0020407F84|nr:hypothetical protein [Priestia megaterium]MCM3197150.1 hypothetical protein [Priestia megaterium]